MVFQQGREYLFAHRLIDWKLPVYLDYSLSSYALQLPLPVLG